MTDPIMARLDATRDRADRATEGPWAATVTRQGGRVHDPDGYPLPGCNNCGENTEVYEGGDAEFIAAARTDVPRMEAALRAVLDEHRRAEQYQRLAGSPRASEWEHYCPADQKTWPCPTYRAIADALGVETEGGDR